MGQKGSIREIVSANLMYLRDHSTLPKGQLAVQATRGLPENNLRRARNGENITLDNLQQCAEAYGLEAWELLVPGIDLEDRFVVRTESEVSEEASTSAKEAASKIINQMEEARAGKKKKQR